MFGESVFALIPDHEVRAAKLTNKWISGCGGTGHAKVTERAGIKVILESSCGRVMARVDRKLFGKQQRMANIGRG